MTSGLHYWARRAVSPDVAQLGSLESYRKTIAKHFKPSQIVAPQRIDAPATLQPFDFGQLKLICCDSGFDVSIVAPAFENRYLLHVPLEGGFSVKHQQREHQIDTQSLLLIRPGQPIHLELPKHSRFLVVQFSGDMLPANIPWLTQAKGEDHFITRRTDKTAPLLGALSYLYHEIAEAQRGFNAAELAVAMTPVIARRIVRSFEVASRTQRSNSKQYELTAAAQKMMLRRGVGEHVQMAEVALKFGVSMRTLQRAFMSIEHCTPYQWLLTKRLEHAHQQMTDTRTADKTVTQIALESGFQDLGRFAKSYRDQFGELPSVTLKKQ